MTSLQPTTATIAVGVATAALAGYWLGSKTSQTPPSPPPSLHQKSINSNILGVDDDGEIVMAWTLRNRDGTFQITLSSLGCAITSCIVNQRDIVLGYDNNLESSRSGGKQNFGTIVGRCANRIAKGTFQLNGKRHQLDTNNGANHLHGGHKGLFGRNFRLCDTCISTEFVSIKLVYHSADGEEGYPGACDIFFELIVPQDGSSFEMQFSARNATQDTVLSLTNHCYWNLNGHASGTSVASHQLHLPHCSHFTATNDTNAVTGETPHVDSSPGMDFRTNFKQLAVEPGELPSLDVNYCIDKDAAPLNNNSSSNNLIVAARLQSNGLRMTVSTNAPGVQIYTGGGIDCENSQWKVPGKGGVLYQKCGAICIETQNYPDAINHSIKFGHNSVLKMNELYFHVARHVFEVVS